MNVRRQRIEALELEINRAVDALVVARVNEALAGAAAVTAQKDLHRAIGKLSSEALESETDPDPESMTDDEKVAFVRRSAMPY